MLILVDDIVELKCTMCLINFSALLHHLEAILILQGSTTSNQYGSFAIYINFTLKSTILIHSVQQYQEKKHHNLLPDHKISSLS